MRRELLISLLVLTVLVACGDDETTPVGQKPVPTAPRSGLVAEYLFDGNANDSQGNNHGTLVGGTFWVHDRFGAANSAARFDGADDEIATVMDEFVGGDSVSVSLWFNVPATGVGSSYFVTCSDFGMFISDADAGMAISIPATSSAKGPFTTANVWHHLLGTYDGDDITVYIDGAFAATTNHPGSISDPNYPLTFAHFGTSYWEGALDDVRIYDRTITSATEISNLYHEGGYSP